MTKETENSLFTESLFGKTTESPVEKTKKRAIPKDLPEINKKGKLLFIPEGMKQRFKEEGFDLAWLRIYIGNGELDIKEIRKKESEGYTFVTRAEAPEMGTNMTSFFEDAVEKHGELIITGDLALGKIPSYIRKEREKALEQETKKRSKSIINDLRRHQIGDPSRGDVYKTEVERPNTRNVEFGE
jgi:hypothetical protein